MSSRSPSEVPGDARRSITAFVSWAHVHRSSEPDEVKRWTRRVYEFVVALIDSGIDADVDLLNLHRDDVDWSTYGVDAIERADYVVIVASRAYGERWDGSNDPTVGAGAAREANALKSLFEENQRTFKKRIKVALLDDVEVSDIPLELRSVIQRFRIAAPDKAGVEGLVRTLVGIPLWERPPVGPLPVLEQQALRRWAEDELGQTHREDEDRATDRLAVRGVLEAVERREREQGVDLARRRGEWNQHFKVPHKDTVTGIAFNPDRSLLVTGSADTTAEIWAVDDREQVRRLKHDAPVNAVNFWPAGEGVAVAAGTAVHVWPLEGEARSLAHERAALRLAFSPDGRLLATLQEYSQEARETLRLWPGFDSSGPA